MISCNAIHSSLLILRSRLRLRNRPDRTANLIQVLLHFATLDYRGDSRCYLVHVHVWLQVLYRVVLHRGAVLTQKLSVVLLCFLCSVHAEEAAGHVFPLILHGKNFVKTANIVDLLLTSHFILFGELLGTHLVPEHRALLMHLLQVSISHDPLKNPLPTILSNAEQAEGV